MWTGDERVFFYNPSTRQSLWERPQDLIGRSDVDKMILEPAPVNNKKEEKKGECENHVRKSHPLKFYNVNIHL